MPRWTYEGRSAVIDKYGHPVVYALTEPYMSYRAKVYKDVFFWTANIATPGADTNLVWMRNTSPTKLLRLDLIQIYSSATAEIETFTGTGNTAGGSLVAGNNTYVGQPDDQQALFYTQNTNVDAGAGMTNMGNFRIGATNEEELKVVGALTLPYDYEFAINIITAAIANVKLNFMGFFDPPVDVIL